MEQHLLHLHKFVYRLDGDNIRFGLCKDLGFDEQSRNENIRRIGEVGHFKLCAHLPFIARCRRQVAKLFADSQCIAITAFISPYIVDRALARELHEKANIPFIEVYVDAPLDIVEKRDPKGLYKRARAGEIRGMSRVLSHNFGSSQYSPDFTGISAPYEAPVEPELHIKTHETDITESVRVIMAYLVEKNYVTA